MVVKQDQRHTHITKMGAHVNMDFHILGDQQSYYKRQGLGFWDCRSLLHSLTMQHSTYTFTHKKYSASEEPTSPVESKCPPNVTMEKITLIEGYNLEFKN
eukprot:1149577-Pelagomonas_calceolata.AAC.5